MLKLRILCYQMFQSKTTLSEQREKHYEEIITKLGELVGEQIVTSTSNVYFLNNHTYEKSILSEIILRDRTANWYKLYTSYTVRQKNDLLWDLISIFKDLSLKNNDISSVGQILNGKYFLDSVKVFLQQKMLVTSVI